MISKVFHDFSMIFQWTLWLAWSPSNFELVQNSLSVLFEGSRLLMNPQRSLNERSTVSPVFQWSLSNLPTNATVLVNSLGHSVISVGTSWSLRDLSWSFREHRWSHNERSMNSQCLLLGLSTKAQRSPRSLRGLPSSPWNLLKMIFFFGSLNDLLARFHWDNLFGGLGDCWEILSIVGRSMVSHRSCLCGKGS